MKIAIASLRWDGSDGSWWGRRAPPPGVPVRVRLEEPAPSSPVAPAHETAHADPRVARVRARLQRGTLALPMMPDVAQAARRLVDRGHPAADAVTALAVEDPALAARLVLASASPSDARSVRGVVEELEPRILAAVLLRAAHASVPVAPRFARDLEASSRRARRCVVAAEAIASRLGLAPENLELAALLHDVGELRVWRVVADAYPDIPREDARAIVAALHEEAGADLARSWRLPACVVDTCAAHHALGPGAPLLQRVVAAAGAVVDAATRGLTAERLEVLAMAGVGASLAKELVARLAPGRSRE